VLTPEAIIAEAPTQDTDGGGAPHGHGRDGMM
jgi:hypothetical protein